MAITKLDLTKAVSGTLPADNYTAKTGSVIQVVTNSDDTLSNYSLNNTFSQVTGLNTSITPSSTSSKILVLVSMYVCPDATTSPYIGMRLTRGGSVITDSYGKASGSRVRQTFSALIAQDSNSAGLTVSHNFVDSPATTSATTYGIQVKGFSSRTFNVNYSGASDANVGQTTRSTMTLMEIVG